MTTFKKGDRFIPHKPKEDNTRPRWHEEMDEYDGKTLIVHHVGSYTGAIEVEYCHFLFHPDWCEKVGDSEIPNNHIPEVGKVIDWEQRKWELLKECSHILMKEWVTCDPQEGVRRTIIWVDEIIKQLKGE